MKKIIALLFALLTCNMYAQSTTKNITDFILSTYSAKNFTVLQVNDSDIEEIINCGIKAPSARNSQLWKFTVVKDIELERKVISNITEGNVLIIISGSEEKPAGIDVVFDCALATENMYIAAQGLGLGAHIYTGPIDGINKNFKKELKIPEGYKAIAVLRIGSVEAGVDITSAASKRKVYNEVVNESKK
jgi:nitroreductase